jgi:DNA-binding Xre family transcriptional regulator
MLTFAVPDLAKRRRLSGTLAERVKHLLDERGEGASWLAEQIGVHRVSASRIVNGKATDLPLSTLKAIATALGVTVGQLVDDGG